MGTENSSPCTSLLPDFLLDVKVTVPRRNERNILNHLPPLLMWQKSLQMGKSEPRDEMITLSTVTPDLLLFLLSHYVSPPQSHPHIPPALITLPIIFGITESLRLEKIIESKH